MTPILALCVAALCGSLLVAGVRVVNAPGVVLGGYAAVVPFGSALAVAGLGAFGTLSTALGAAAMAVLALRLSLSTHRAASVDATLAVWLGFVGVAALSITWSIAPEVSVRQLLVLASLVTLYGLVALTAWTPRDRRRLEVGIAVGGAVAATYGLVLAATGALAEDEKLRFRLAGGGGEGAADANVTAAALLLPLAVTLGELARHPRRPVRLAAASVAAMLVIAIVLTGSRGGILSAGVVAVVSWLNGPRRRVLGVAIAVTAVAGVLGLTLATSEANERVRERSLSGRTDIWAIGLRECPTTCVTGAGTGAFPQVHERGLLRYPDVYSRVHRFQAHNIVLEAAIELGLLGLALLVVGLVMTARRIRVLPRELRGPPMAAFAGVVVANMFLSTFDFKYFWLVLIYVAVVLASVRSAGSTSGARAPVIGRPA